MIRRKKNSKSGFTLVEIVVAIAIMVVLLAVLSPSLLRYTENSRMQKDDSAASELTNTIKLAMSDAETFDEVCAYAIANNYVTYTDSSGVYGAKTTDEEHWAPDGSGHALTITFNPDENGNFDIAKGLVNNMTEGNGSVSDTRTIAELKQCYFSEMGNSKLYTKVQQTFGPVLAEKSATYKNSSYTVFIKLTNMDGLTHTDVYGEWSGTNLTDTSPAAIITGTPSFTPEDEEPTPETPNQMTPPPQYSGSDLVGGGSSNLGNNNSSTIPDDDDELLPGAPTPENPQPSNPDEELPPIDSPDQEPPQPPAHSHSYSETETTPTCTTGGYITYTCECGESYTANEVPARGHTFTTATCTTPKTCSVCGVTEGSTAAHNYSAATCTTPKTCTSCGTTEGTASGHTYSNATCTKAKTCTVCGVTEGTALGHNWIAATCTIAKKCSACGATEGSAAGHTWKNATCTTPKTCTTCNATEGNANGHTWGAATCTTAKKCSVCNTTSGSAEGHSWIAATCTKAKTCSKCNATSGSAAGHTWVAATCTKAKTCSKCNTTSGSALGHTWKAATCTAPKTCSVCGATTGSAKGHSYTTKVVAPTFSAQGYTLHTCSTCGNSYKDAYVAKLPTPDATFANNSWANIQKIVAAGKFSETGWKVGDTKSVTINGVSLTVRIIGVNHDGNNTITLMCTKSIGMHLFNEAVNGSSTNAGGWKDSDMREWLNGTIYNGLSSDLKSAIKPVSKKTNNVGNGDKSATATATTDKLFLLSLAEANITHTFDTDGEGTAYQYFVNTKYNLRGWFRSPRIDSPKNFCDFNNSNTIGSNYAAYPNANVIPAFVIG